ncbi:OPT/YSL family transporter [Adlercreutzia faecimuris]|uniref:OPT/YSL family transporter n=1 Tax=Adlercreutzia faecimuris TaxID=2897341 RepID=A0ABS9WG95_9ACTN|nr:OPT/YSL family transporter [Adlercreutzia sp. JBNU-10]MCI2241886.1 OPT/YSL family transporter [Adlercreutzia sp. JBNU-10]
MSDLKGQLTLRGVVVGCVGCVVITASSVYTALRMGALPWPIIFAAIVSLFFLRAVSRGRSTLNEANVTHTVMSSGAMVAGGLAFTIPGAWMLGLADEISALDLAVIAVGGVVLGLVGSVLLRRHFIEEEGLEYPIGQAAAQTLKAGDAGGATGRRLFGAMGAAGLYALLRDGLGVIPSMLAALPVPGVAFGIYNSPLSLAVGFLVGTGAVLVWFAGALIANFGIIVGAPALGLCDVATAQAVVSSLGMGLMMGCGVAVIARDILPRGLAGARRAWAARRDAAGVVGLTAASAASARPAPGHARRRSAGVAALAVAAVALAAATVLGLPPAVAAAVVLLAFVAAAMAAQSVGQTGIDPLEIFGLIVMLLIAAFADVAPARLFFIAALVAVAAGLAGDVMNDFKAGHVLGTSPRAQWVGQAIGGVVGALVAVAALEALLAGYGPDAFGPGRDFVAAQASVVATMVGGIPHVPAFAVGLAAGFALYLAGFPAMMLGLGVYLPFYLSFTGFLGAMAKVAWGRVGAWRRRGMAPEERAAAEAADEERGLIVASGLMGGESIMGIVLAMIVAGGALLS